MRRVNRRFPLIIAALMLAPGLSGCDGEKSPPASANSQKLVAVTVLPLQMLASAVVGSTTAIRVELLLSPELGCPHDYALTVRDKKRVDDASVVLCVGLGLESFLEPLRRKQPEKFIDLGGECATISMEVDEHAGHDHEHDGHNHDEHGHDHETHDHAGSVNPHVWLSPTEAIVLTRAIQRELSRIDPNGANTYAANAATQIASLEKVAQEFRGAAETLKGKRIAASDAFAYLARELGLRIAVPLPDHESGSVPARAKGELTRRAKAEKVDLIIQEDGAPSALSAAIARDASIPTLTLDTLTRSEKPALGVSAYESRMRANLAALQKRLLP